MELITMDELIDSVSSITRSENNRVDNSNNIYLITTDDLITESVSTQETENNEIEEEIEECSENETSSDDEIVPVPKEIIKDTETTARFNSAAWVEFVKRVNINVLGCGGIGSWVTLLLSRIKPNSIAIWDTDVVEGVNLSGQCFGLVSEGKNKTVALREICADLSNYYNISGSNSDATYIKYFPVVTIACFDNMVARKRCFNNWKKHRLDNTIFIDGRLAAERFQIYCIKSNEEIKKYEEEALFSDSEREQTVCSFKQTSHIATMIGSFIVSYVTNYLYNINTDDIIQREVPYFTYFDAASVTLKKEFV